MRHDHPRADLGHIVTVHYSDPAGRAFIVDVHLAAGMTPFDNPAQDHFPAENRRLKRKEWINRMAAELARELADKIEDADL